MSGRLLTESERQKREVQVTATCRGVLRSSLRGMSEGRIAVLGGDNGKVEVIAASPEDGLKQQK